MQPGKEHANAVRNCTDAAPSTSPPGRDQDVAAWAVTTLDGDRLIDQIAALPACQWPWGAPLEGRVRMLCVHPEPHCTYEIDLRCPGGWHRLIGKAYATDHRDVYEAMEALTGAGFGPEVEVSVPRPIAYLSSLHLLLQERVDGTSAKDAFASSDRRQWVAAARRCGRWLGRFQTRAPLSGQRSGVGRLLRSSERKCRLITEADSTWAVRCERLLEELQAGALALDAGLTCPGHGDFCEHQIVLTERRTAVLDWDLYDVAHPARDVAKFLVSLERVALKHHGSVRALDGAGEEFLRAYLDFGGHARVPAVVPLYKAMFWLKGRTKAFQTRAAGWRDEAEIMLAESSRNIAAFAVPHRTG